jgi:hypothetical protein
MDPDQTARMRRLVWIHAGRKPIILVFCRDAAHMPSDFSILSTSLDLRKNYKFYVFRFFDVGGVPLKFRELCQKQMRNDSSLASSPLLFV